MLKSGHCTHTAVVAAAAPTVVDRDTIAHTDAPRTPLRSFSR